MRMVEEEKTRKSLEKPRFPGIPGKFSSLLGLASQLATGKRYMKQRSDL
jgi:hypothetical protein